MEEHRYLAEHLSEDTILMDFAHELFRLLFTDELGQRILSLFNIHYASCVVDTNVFLRDLAWTLTRGRTSSLILAARVGTLRLYASVQVHDEVLEKMVTRAKALKIDSDAAYQLWKTTYVPLIRFLDPGKLFAQEERMEKLRQRDPDDLPTAQLIELLRPSIVLSEDKDLAAFGSLVVPLGQVTSAYRDHAERDANVVLLGLGGGLVLQLSFGAWRLLALLLARIPRWVLVGVGIALSVAVVIPRTRRALWQGLLTLITRLQGTQIVELLGELQEGLAHMEEQSQLARSFLQQQERIARPPQRALDYLVAVLTLTGETLSVQEITNRMIAKGYHPRGQHPERYIRQLLHTHPHVFEQQDNKRWRIVSLIDR